MPIAYHPRPMSEGKKIRARDGWETILTLWKHRHWKASQQ